MISRNVKIQGTQSDIECRNYRTWPASQLQVQAKHAEEWGQRFIRTAIALGFSVVQDSVYFEGTPTEQAEKWKELTRLMAPTSSVDLRCEVIQGDWKSKP